MVRLDADLLARTPTFLNPLKDRELDLRGHKIGAIENLGVTRDLLDTIDFTDNAISSLSNFPLLLRLHTLLLSNNPVRTLSATLPTSLPNLRTLVLTNGAVPKDSLGAIGDVLARFKKLELLSLKGCPVAEHQYYREWIIYRCKHLRTLDFERVKDKEKAAAKALFETTEGPTTLATSIITASAAAAAAVAVTNGSAAKTFEPGVEAGKAGAGAAAQGKAGKMLTKEDKERVRAAIEAASSVDEIRRLSRMLQQGFVPSEKDLKALNSGSGTAAGEA